MIVEYTEDEYSYRNFLLMKLTLVQLRCTSLVAKHGSFSEAARRCGMSQPSVSASVSELEAALGAPLFRRTTRRVELTAFGRALLPRITEILVETDNLAREARAALDPDKKLLRIAFSPLIDSRRLSALIEPFRRARPDVEVIFKECDVAGLETRLDEEQIDMACGLHLGDRPSRGSCFLYSEGLRFLPSGGIAMSPTGPIELRDVAGETFVLTAGNCGLAPATRALFDNVGIPLNEYPGQAMTYAALEEWADLGIGAALLPESRIRGDARRFPALAVDGRPVQLRYEALWLRTSSAKPHLKACFQFLRRVSRMLARASWQ